MANDEKDRLKHEASSFEDLCALMALLRAPGGCPWDAEQDHRSIRKNLIEEAYEACDAIDNEDAHALCEELGDLCLQVVFHAQIAAERGEFTMEDVLREICQKLIVRHPHVFGETMVSGAGEVLQNWESIKNQTKGMKTLSDTLDGVAQALPALMRAQKLISRTKKQKRACADLLPTPQNDSERIAKALFLLVEEAQSQGIDAEEALTLYNNLYVRQAHTTK